MLAIHSKEVKNRPVPRSSRAVAGSRLATDTTFGPRLISVALTGLRAGWRDAEPLAGEHFVRLGWTLIPTVRSCPGQFGEVA